MTQQGGNIYMIFFTGSRAFQQMLRTLYNRIISASERLTWISEEMNATAELQMNTESVVDDAHVKVTPQQRGVSLRRR